MPSIVDFYSGQNIFLTGASGFVGVCFLEKVLRTVPNHGEIYLLLRPKRGKEVLERFEELKKNRIFQTLLETSTPEEVFRNVYPISGDVGSDNLGVSPQETILLQEKVNIIVHSAATLDFADSLKTTTNINLKGTRRTIDLAKKCTNLKVFCHISSAYANAFLLETEEILYDPPCDPNELIDKMEKISKEELEMITPDILKDHPNAYTITKHLAEHEVKEVQNLFPCTIVRPAMITGAWKEPIPGWTMSKNGPQGFFLGAQKGVVRRLPTDTNIIYDYIPVDIVVNTILAATYTAAISQTPKVQIYHCTSSTRNPFRWNLIEHLLNPNLHAYPAISAVWYPHLKFVPSITWFRISAFFFHIIPGLILDTLMRVFGGRPILMRLHRNIGTSLNHLQKFIFTEWRFNAENTDQLHKSLSKVDQVLFGVDLSDLRYSNYFKDLLLGARDYLGNESFKTLKKAKSRQNFLFILHISLQVVFIALIWYIFACVMGMTMKSAVFIVPITYFLFNLL